MIHKLGGIICCKPLYKTKNVELIVIYNYKILEFLCD